MFDFFSSPDKKARARAQHWLELARKVWDYRRDVLAPAESEELRRGEAELSRLVKDRAVSARLEVATQALEAVLKRTGGAYYPRGALAENVEFLLVATFVIRSFSIYFVQPMVIPTNSMWPTYYGMTAENFPPGGAAPGALARIGRLAAFGAVRKEVDAPVSGDVSLPLLVDQTGQPHLIPSAAMGRKWLVIPEKVSEYTIFVNDVPARVRVPEDFHDFDKVALATFFPPGHPFAEQWEKARLGGRLRQVEAKGSKGGSFYVYLLPLDLHVNAGDPLLRFDILKGDMVFVDRVTFNFRRPWVGTAFVFETGDIPGILREGIPDEYIIKRLAGLPGDTLNIVPPVLYRNGKPIEGAKAFDENARQVDSYNGYLNAPPGPERYLRPGVPATVPPHSFMGLGDNSPISEDGRYWGFVPEKDVIGRPIFIYYPFTRRWASAR
ncbi:MAG TPA: signal peptidase I [Opitutaceae bacterium]